MRRVAIIGSNSYIARNLIYYFEQHHMDELFLYDAADRQIDDTNYDYQKIDILSKESVASIDMKVDTIYYFVGKTGSANGFDDPDVFLDINERALLYVLNEYVNQGSKAKVIFPSTRLIYDNNKMATEKEVTETFNTIYALNKYVGEQYLRMYSKVYGVRYCILRICLPYGSLVAGAESYGTAVFMLQKAKNGQMIPLYGDGEVRRTITYIGDLCRVLSMVGESDKCVNDLYNVGGEDYSLKEMAEVIAQKYQIGIEYIPYPPIAQKIESGDTVFDDTKLQTILGDYIHMKYKEWINK